MSKKKKKTHEHFWNTVKLFGENCKYVYRICIECGHSQRAKLTWRDYEVKK